MSEQPEQQKKDAVGFIGSVAAYAPPRAVRSGTLASLAEGSYSTGQSDDGDYHTVKWQ
ncbi:hypothetical protein [Streptomyces lydicus]|uniref:hypothetical protein n=1 Tax=Streptomyces lydicus TaxID=47763 RepID=UPI0013E97C95|nr:hypothetical protein [Streptomyces lydicus]MCZ1012206.1 hypothetical protein [Streptomyces lydicus]